MGKGDLAIKISDWFLKSEDYNLSYIVPVLPEPVWTSSISKYAESKGVKIIDSGHYKDVPENVQIDLAFSIFYDKIIKQDFIDRCGKIINLHNSPLPMYRGVSPINWALKDGRDEHGITIHEITKGIDDGPIISQIKYSIYPEIDEVEDVYKRAQSYGYTLFEQTIPNLYKIKAKEQSGDFIYHPSSEDHLLGDRRFFNRLKIKKESE